MKKPGHARERALRIELVRARAALERQSLARDVQAVGAALTPSSLFRGLFPKLSTGSATNWLMHAFRLTRRYPLLASGASALLTGAGKRKRWWRIAAGLLVSWQMARVLGKTDSR
jgi:hypothetical protein